MTDLRELLTDAVADVEPGYALDDIRARTTPSKRRWPYAAGGAVLAVAASFAAFAVLGPDTTPTAVDPGSTTSPSPTVPTSEPPDQDLVEHTTPVYYVGDTPDGPRLFREVRKIMATNPFEAAIAALEQEPLDPDYRTYWPEGAIDRLHFDGFGDHASYTVVLTDESLHDRPADMDETTARMAVEQVINTLRVGSPKASVQFALDHNPIDQVFGVPTSEPLTTGVVLDTLAHVSITTPSEGMLVDNDEPLVVEGVGNSFEGNIVTWIEDRAGTVVVDQTPTIAGTYEDKLFPFEVTLDLTEVAPGDYLVVSSTDDPSGQGRNHVDDRHITVVD